jgi:hypothetical protein
MLIVRIVVWFQSPVTRSNCLSDISSLQRGRCNRPDGALTHWAWGIFRHVRVPPNPHSEASPRLGTFDREKTRTDSAAGANSVSCAGGKSLPPPQRRLDIGSQCRNEAGAKRLSGSWPGPSITPRFQKLWRTGPCSLPPSVGCIPVHGDPAVPPLAGGLTWARYRMAPDTFKRMTTLQFRDLLLSGNCASTTLHLW